MTFHHWQGATWAGNVMQYTQLSCTNTKGTFWTSLILQGLKSHKLNTICETRVAKKQWLAQTCLKEGLISVGYNSTGTNPSKSKHWLTNQHLNIQCFHHLCILAASRSIFKRHYSYILELFWQPPPSLCPTNHRESWFANNIPPRVLLSEEFQDLDLAILKVQLCGPVCHHNGWISYNKCHASTNNKISRVVGISAEMVSCKNSISLYRVHVAIKKPCNHWTSVKNAQCHYPHRARKNNTRRSEIDHNPDLPEETSLPAVSPVAPPYWPHHKMSPVRSSSITSSQCLPELQHELYVDGGSMNVISTANNSKRKQHWPLCMVFATSLKPLTPPVEEFYATFSLDLFPFIPQPIIQASLMANFMSERLNALVTQL